MAPGYLCNVASCVLAAIDTHRPELRITRETATDIADRRPGAARGTIVIVYSISKPDGTVVLYGWGPTDKPLAPLIDVGEGVALARSVAAGELELRNLLGTEVSGLNAARIVSLLRNKKGNCGRRGVPVAVVTRGRVTRFPSIAAAARSLGMSEPNLNWYLHFLPSGVAVYVVPAKRVTRKRTVPVAAATPVPPIDPIIPVVPR